MQNTYNGWTNKQTWNINLTYESFFIQVSKETEFESRSHMAEYFEYAVQEAELTESLSELARNLVSEYLDAVNWKEIAKHYFSTEQ